MLAATDAAVLASVLASALAAKDAAVLASTLADSLKLILVLASASLAN